MQTIAEMTAVALPGCEQRARFFRRLGLDAPLFDARAKVINLMDALRRSVESGRGKGSDKGERRKPTRSRTTHHHRATKKAARSTARHRKAS
jgi:hypothetical protein